MSVSVMFFMALCMKLLKTVQYIHTAVLYRNAVHVFVVYDYEVLWER